MSPFHATYLPPAVGLPWVAGLVVAHRGRRASLRAADARSRARRGWWVRRGAKLLPACLGGVSECGGGLCLWIMPTVFYEGLEGLHSSYHLRRVEGDGKRRWLLLVGMLFLEE